MLCPEGSDTSNPILGCIICLQADARSNPRPCLCIYIYIQQNLFTFYNLFLYKNVFILHYFVPLLLYRFVCHVKTLFEQSFLNVLIKRTVKLNAHISLCVFSSWDKSDVERDLCSGSFEQNLSWHGCVPHVI